MAFDPDAYLSQNPTPPKPSGAPAKNLGEFNPDEYLLKKQVSSAPSESDSMGQAKAALQGFGQGAAAGYLPQLQAVAGGLLPNPTADIDKKLREQGFDVQNSPDTYLSRRDQFVKEQQELQKQYPKTYLGSQIGGAIASAPLASKALGAVAPALTATEGVGKAGRIARAAGAGAAMGFAQNPGDVEGQIGAQIPERTMGAVGGAVTGGVLQGAGEAVSGAGKRLSEYAQIKAFKSTGAMLKDFRRAEASGRMQDIGKEMIAQGMVKPGSTVKDVAEKSADLKEKAGTAIGDIYKSVNERVNNPQFLQTLDADKTRVLQNSSLDAVNWSNQLQSQFKQDLKGKMGGTAALGKMQTVLQELADNGNNANLHDIQRFKSNIDDVIKYNKALSDEPLTKQYLFKVRDFLKDRIQDRVNALDHVVGSQNLKELKEANKQYGIFAEINRIANDRVLRDNANRSFGLTDTIMGAGGAAGGAALGGMLHGDLEHGLMGAAAGLGLGLINKAGRTYGVPLTTTAAHKAGQSLQGGLLTKTPVTTGILGPSLLNRPKYNKQQGISP